MMNMIIAFIKPYLASLERASDKDVRAALARVAGIVAGFANAEEPDCPDNIVVTEILKLLAIMVKYPGATKNIAVAVVREVLNAGEGE